MNWRSRDYGIGSYRRINPRTGQYETVEDPWRTEQARKRRAAEAERALTPVNKNAASKPKQRRADPNNPPYGQSVGLSKAFSGLPTGLLGKVPDKELFDSVFDGSRCPVRFRGEIFHCPWDILVL